ncbi:pyridoxal phosphate-dependent decarboxylase family protein [Roseobacter sp. GAI101]|uniref:pyridoxal phosphate-dependent decarboxylase family protein n=1 Tax=Roseobacter sp. (strain GAI101) TaxID=391589 RepID=UPI00018722F8|nr:pyridoxal-dependent decarboxylase [Roseobacter sp. GAI101]EEB84732.1 group II decarboxylase family protein [Roseobacter sp. GAI101]
MTTHESKEHFAKVLSAFHQTEQKNDRFDLLNAEGSPSLAGWFIGPMGENASVMQRLVAKAVAANASARHEYGTQFHDPVYVTDAIKATQDYKSTINSLEANLDQMLDALHGSIPLSSYRNQSHMYWDCTMPGFVGYFAAMLYNQNNVAAEASPVTTMLEIEVGKDLCRMLGYTVPETETSGTDTIVPWGHITCDGSIANAESMWAARNLSYLPVSLANAIRLEPEMAAAKDFVVNLVQGGSAKLVELDNWGLMNLGIDEVINLTPNIEKKCGISADTIKAMLDKYSVQNIGLAEMHRTYLQDLSQLPVLMAPSTRHYSWPKGAALLGLGANHVISTHVDLDGRMKIDHLRENIERCYQDRRPVLEVVAVMGTTEESSVDPLADIIALREEYRAKGMEFSVHVDGAWGGYFASILREPRFPEPEIEDGAVEHTPAMVMSDYVTRQYQALRHADTQTVDPHKAGFIPYPAGALCYRNGAMRELIAFTAPVVYHGGVDPNVGVYGIEGSKPGAAAAGVYLSHALIRPDKSGYGKLLGKCIFNSKRFYGQLLDLAGENECFKVVPFQRLPAQKQGKSDAEVAAQLALIRNEIVPRENDDLLEYFMSNPEAQEVFREMGSDQNIVTYALNFRSADGWNTDVKLANDFNTAIFRALSIGTFSSGTVPTNPMFVTSSSFEVGDYGQCFVDAFGARLSLAPTNGAGINFLVSTTQDPWVTATDKGNWLPIVLEGLKKTALEQTKLIVDANNLRPWKGA